MGKSSNTYDVIIIGAGISGLVCGCYLAKAGIKVLIVEQNNKPGGYFKSFKRKDFTFDAAAHSFGNYREGGHVRKVLTELGIDKLIKIKRFDPSDIIITPDFKINFYNNIGKTITDLINIFPKERDNIINFFNFIMSSNKSEFSKLKNKTFDFLLHSFFKDDKLINSIALPISGNGGLPPSLMHAFSGVKILSEDIIDGGYYPGDCIQSIPNALSHIIKQNNGRIFFNKLVRKIIIKNNNVNGIILSDNEIINSKYVVSSCDMTQTFKTFLGEKIIGERNLKNLRNFVPSLSAFVLYIGIDRPFKGLPKPGVNIWNLPYYDLDESYKQILKCKFNNTCYLLRVSPNKKTILALSNAPFKTKSFWKLNKEKIAQDVLNNIEKLIPNLKKHIVYFDAASPSTLYKYTLNYKGSSFGWAKIPSQIFDPIFSRTTFINGLYLTGHWTSIAFGMPGTCYSGYDTASRILRKERIL